MKASATPLASACLSSAALDVHRQHFGKLRQSCGRGVVGAELDPAHVGDTADLTLEIHPLR